MGRCLDTSALHPGRQCELRSCNTPSTRIHCITRISSVALRKAVLGALGYSGSITGEGRGLRQHVGRGMSMRYACLEVKSGSDCRVRGSSAVAAIGLVQG